MSLIIYNGKVYTMDVKNPIAEAIYIENEKIINVGTNEEILKLKSLKTKLIDCKGKTVIPGLNDSHLHLYSTGVSLQMINLNKEESIEDIINKVSSFINSKAIAPNNWVKGRGWNQDYFKNDKRFLTKYDLDKISKDHPIVLTRACGHVAVVNSKALELCNVNKNTKQVSGGIFDIDETGEPLGVFRENALDLIYGVIPNPTLKEIKETLIEAMDYANSQGLTSVQTDDLSHLPNKDYKMMIKAYEELRDEGKLTCRVYQQCLLTTQKDFKDFLSLGYITGFGDVYFKIGPLKILSDGSLGARTAALKKPYADDLTTNGIMCFSREQLDKMIYTAHNANMQVAIHCIGDRAMYMVLDSYEKAIKNKSDKNHRHSIIHCQITDQFILNKFKELDIIAHIQPIFLHYDLHIVESRVGKKLSKTSYAFKSMLKKGINTAYGTDSPIEPLDTMPNIYCAVTRKDLKGYPENGWNQGERVSVNEAVYQYTMGSAYASFEEHIKGSIQEGKLADITVLNEDIFSIKEDLIKDVLIDMTFVGGILVYSRKDL